MYRLAGLGVTLVLVVVALAACESADNSAGGQNDARTRLVASNSSAKFGQYIIQVNAMSTADLTPEVAQGYGIVRSPNQGLVNLVVLGKADDGVEKPLGGKVEVSAANLTGQLKNIELREINESSEGGGIYYIGVVSVADRETINFDFDVQPEGSSQLLLIRYTHEFYTK